MPEPFVLPPPLLEPEADWQPFDFLPSPGKVGRGFVSGDPDGERLRIRYYLRPSDNALVGRVWFGPWAEGPPRCAHGGSMAAVLDEAMGRCAWMNGHRALAGQLQVRFRRVCPLGTTADAVAVIDRVEGRKVYTIGRLVPRGGGEPFCEAEGLFIALSDERIAELAARLIAAGGPDNA